MLMEQSSAKLAARSKNPQPDRGADRTAIYELSSSIPVIQPYNSRLYSPRYNQHLRGLEYSPYKAINWVMWGTLGGTDVINVIKPRTPGP